MHLASKKPLDQDQHASSAALDGLTVQYNQRGIISQLRKLVRRPAKGQLTAVSNLSFKALQGQITVTIGANGSGNSTVLSAITGLREIKSGSIEVHYPNSLRLCP